MSDSLRTVIMDSVKILNVHSRDEAIGLSFLFTCLGLGICTIIYFLRIDARISVLEIERAMMEARLNVYRDSVFRMYERIDRLRIVLDKDYLNKLEGQ